MDNDNRGGAGTDEQGQLSERREGGQQQRRSSRDRENREGGHRHKRSRERCVLSRSS